VPTPGNRSPYFSSRLTFAELAWRVAQYDGVIARIPGATARASSGRRLLAFERPDDIEAAESAAGVEPAVAYDVLVGEPAPLDLIARRLGDVRGRVRVVRRADGLYQIVVPPWDVVRVRALGAALARAHSPRELDVLYLEQAELRAARTLRTGPDEDDPVVRTVPSGTRVTTVHGFLGAVFSDRVTNAGTLYVVTEIDAGFGFDWPDALSAVR
jgi:hypothetical protein